jgi:putative lumazine-binding protein
MRFGTSLIVAVALTVGSRASAAQNPQPAPPQGTPAARPEDVASVDAIVAALYDVISGPAGQPRDWERFRSLFGAGARLIPTGKRPDGTHSVHVYTPDEYAANATPFFARNGFFEREIGRRAEQFGGVVHVFSAYESKYAASDGVPFARGINSIQLVNDGQRWRVMTIMWEAERPENRIAERYLAPRASFTAADEAGVRAALQHYLSGHATGSQDEMRQAFHPDARMTFVRDGKLVITPIAEYIARFDGKPAADEAQRKRRITDVEITGNAATGRIELDYPSAFLVDYMTLLKDNGRWVIIAKSFNANPNRSR